MNVGTNLRAALLAILGATVALALAIAFWLTLGYRVTLPAWQIVVLPAALVGLFAGRLAARWSVALVVIVAIFAAAVAGVGEWIRGAYAFNASLQMTVSAARNEQTNAMLARMASQPLPKEALEKLQTSGANAPEPPPATTNTDLKEVAKSKASDKDGETEKSPIVRKSPTNSLWQAGLAHIRSTNPWPGWIASMIVGQIAAFWAARVAIASTLHQPMSTSAP